jgi:hypothetical protein
MRNPRVRRRFRRVDPGAATAACLGWLAGQAVMACLGAAPARAEEPDPRYWRLADIVATFDDWSAAYPDIFHLTSLGLSGQGAVIPLVRISDHAASDEPEPAVVFHAAQHANECNGTGAIMRQMEALLTGYGHDPAVTARVDGLEIWFIPVFNVDGHGYVFSGAVSWDQWRKTLRDNNDNGQVDFPLDGVDLNRNWDWFWQECGDNQPGDDYYKGPNPWSEAETIALREFVLAERPVVLVDYHSPATIGWTSDIFYPWQSTHGWGHSPDFDVVRAIAVGWAAATRDEQNLPYGSIFGYDTLPKEQNWVYGHTGSLTFEMEIADHCWWTGAVVDTIAARVARGSTYVLDRTLHGPGITGRVTDAASGQPLVAEVKLAEMHSTHVGPRLTDLRFGTFTRLTANDTYTVTVSRRDYVSETRTVEVAGNTWTTADFALAPITTAVEDPRPSSDRWVRAANPLRAGQSVRLSLPAELAPARAELYDLRGRRLAVLGQDLAPGRNHDLRLPGRLSAGAYLLRVRAASLEQVVRIVCIE